MITIDEEWLTEEVDADLDEFDIGLYEFIWKLRPRHKDAQFEQLRASAQNVLAGLRAKNDLQLVWCKWATDEERPASWDELDDHSFDDIGEDGWYLVVRRNAGP